MSGPFFYSLLLAAKKELREHDYEELALLEARKSLGISHPNPSVGAVIVKNGKVISQASTESPGLRHAEKKALDLAQESVKGASLYVTLEPCSHFGRTPPCTNAIIESGISRVYYGVMDPNPKVSGQGIAMLEAAGIHVEQFSHIKARNDCALQIAAFKKHILLGLPYVLVKVATSHDNKIAVPGAKAQKITGQKADTLVHRLRRHVDAILIGGNTARLDDPMLTARLDEAFIDRQPLRIVLSSSLNLSPDLKIFNQSLAESWAITGENSNAELFRQKGIKIIRIPEENGIIPWEKIFRRLSLEGITSLLIEPGKKILASLAKSAFVDELWHLAAPMKLGPQGLDIAEDLDYLKSDLKALPAVALGQDNLCCFY